MKMLITIVVTTLLTTVVTSCGGNPPQKPPPRNCETADECWDIKTSINPACGWSAENDGPINDERFGRIPPDIADRQFKIYNMHKSKDILVTIRVTVESQLPESPQISHIPYLIEAEPKGKIKGGRPDGIDLGGPDHFLGCEWTRSGDLIQKYRFEVEKACFKNDQKCQAAPPYSRTNPRKSVDEELARCETLCSSKDPEKCFIYDRLDGDVGNELFNLHRDLVTKQIPFGVNMDMLLTAIGSGTQNCEMRMLDVSLSNDAVASGPYCRIPISTPNGTPSNLTSIILDVPNVISGNFSRIGSGNLTLAKWQLFSRNTVLIEKFDPNSGQIIEEEKVAAIYFGRHQLLVAGSSKFCAVVPYNGG